MQDNFLGLRLLACLNCWTVPYVLETAQVTRLKIAKTLKPILQNLQTTNGVFLMVYLQLVFRVVDNYALFASKQ